MDLNPIISGAQIRAARILLRWSQAELSFQCGVSESSILRIERGALVPRESTREKIALALLKAGIEFIDSVGVTLRPDKRIDTSPHSSARSSSPPTGILI
jgi:transcriptional regulator with XRE-family HTH domain